MADPLPNFAGALPPSLRQRFELLGTLGRGAVGTVLHARERASGREVALKLLHGRLDAHALARLRREGEVTAKLRHPGIIGIHSAGEADGLPYLAYELVVDARPLDVFWEGLETLARATLVRDAALAVGHAHAEGILHRDIKPENVLVDAAGRVRLADFGLATAQDLERLTRTGGVVGTPYYMSPEQLGGLTVGPPSDVWSLGVILYRALTDQLPFEGKGMLELYAAASGSEPTPPRKLNPRLPRPLEAICLKALSKSPEERYPDGDALAQDLARFLAGEGVQASGPNLRALGRRLRRLWWTLPLAASGLLLVVAFNVPTATPGIRVGRTDPQAPVAPRPTAPVVPGAPETLRAAAGRGEVESLFNLGQLLEHGSRLEQLPPNPRAAQRWYERAAEQGDLRAELRLASMERPKDPDAFLRRATLVAGRRKPAAAAALRMLVSHCDEQGDLKSALNWIRQGSQEKQWIEPTWKELADRRWPTVETLRAFRARTPLEPGDPLHGLLSLHEGDLLASQLPKDKVALRPAQGAYRQGLIVGSLPCTGRMLSLAADKLVDGYGDCLAQIRAAAERHPEAAYLLGVSLLEGRGMEQSDGKAIGWLEKAAPDWPPAAYRLALLCRDGTHGVSVSAERAILLLRRASDAGLGEARAALARMLVAGRAEEAYPGEIEVSLREAAASGDELARAFVEPHPGRRAGLAEEGFQKNTRAAALKGDLAAIRTMGRSYRQGEGLSIDLLRSAGWYLRGCRQGDADSMTMLGSLLESHLDDTSGMVYWMTRAARSKAPEGTARANAALAEHYRQLGEYELAAGHAQRSAEAGSSRGMLLWGTVLAKRGDHVQAAEWLRKSAEGKDKIGALAYAEALWNGRGVRADKVEARALLEEAVAAPDAFGSTHAAFILARLCYEDGLYAEARRLLQGKPALANHAEGLLLLGVLELEGKDGAANPRAAAELFRKAAEHGEPAGYYRLGLLHQGGLGGLEHSAQMAARCFGEAALHPKASDTLRVHHARFLASGEAGPARVKEGQTRLQTLAEAGSSEAREVLEELGLR